MTIDEAIKIIICDAMYNRETAELAIKALHEKAERDKADGCKGCAFESVEEWELPCRRCSRNCKDYWRRPANEKRGD